MEGLDESISDYDVLTQKVEVHLMFSLTFFASQLSHSSILTAKLAVIGKCLQAQDNGIAAQALAAEVMELLEGTSLYLVGMMGR